MTEPMTDIAVSAAGLLREFSAYGVLTWADVHPAQHLAFLYGESDERVQLAIALTVRALRAGSLCVDLRTVPSSVPDWDATTDADAGEDRGPSVPPDAWPEPEAWSAAVASSPAVTVGDAEDAPRPLRFVDGLMYLERSWRDQQVVRREILDRVGAEPAPAPAPSRDPRTAGQDAAVASALTRRLTIIAGGPGTGKTRVIARIVAEASAAGSTLIALAAPTGKAAARMTEQLRQAGQDGVAAATLHRLLGLRPGGRTRHQHDAANPLPHDLVIVDELSMVSMSLMAQLLGALKPGARLVLVGDPDQLASVEAGAVLADLTRAEALRPHVVTLTHNFRFAGAIQALASAIRTGDIDSALGALSAGDPAVRLVAPHEADAVVRQRCVAAGRRVLTAAGASSDADTLAALDAHRLLCAHRSGPYGVQHWTRRVTDWLTEEVPGFDPGPEFYVGRPLLMTVNAADLELYNGDTGVIVAAGEQPEAVFATGVGPRRFSPYLLDGLQSLYAMTVHKSQGSQFAGVTVVLPPETSPLLTRELLYTAVTRASDDVVLVGTPESVRRAVQSPAARTSGLALRLR